MIKLADILKGLNIEEVRGNTNISLSDITFDSRKAAPGMLFVAVRGTKTDGHDYISPALAAGSAAVVCEQMPENVKDGACLVRVKDSAYALGYLASAFYKNPSRRFKLVGITGTNGKTTTITLLHRLFMGLGYQSGCFTTIRNYIGNSTVEATHARCRHVGGRFRRLNEAGTEWGTRGVVKRSEWVVRAVV